MQNDQHAPNMAPETERTAAVDIRFPERHPDGHDAVFALLADPASYPGHPSKVEAIETHMSRVFLAGDRVYKIKKALRFPFVDFSSLEQRRLNCVREFELNQQLAPDVYLAVLPIAHQASGALAIGGDGEPVEWLIVMRRLDRDHLLDNALRNGTARPEHADDLAVILGQFYRGARRIELTGEGLLDWWREAVALTASSLTNPLLPLTARSTEKPLEFLQRFLAANADAIAARAPFILDGHGDLRPEHVHLGPPIRLIDRLEFNARLRWTDPFDEAVFLGMECERLGARWFGPRLLQSLSDVLGEAPSPPLLQFYRCYRACLRARLLIEHLLDPSPRTPERWPAEARQCLEMALTPPSAAAAL